MAQGPQLLEATGKFVLLRAGSEDFQWSLLISIILGCPASHGPLGSHENIMPFEKLQQQQQHRITQMYTRWFGTGPKMSRNAPDKDRNFGGKRLCVLVSLECLSPGHHVHSFPHQDNSGFPEAHGFSQLFHITMIPTCSGRLIHYPFELQNALNGQRDACPRKKSHELWVPCPQLLPQGHHADPGLRGGHAEQNGSISV